MKNLFLKSAIYTWIMLFSLSFCTTAFAEETDMTPAHINRLIGTPIGKMFFHTQNLDGEDITEDIFSDKDITVVNVWASWCNPCLREMPELAAWENELPDNAQLLYLCLDLFSLDSSAARA